MANPVKETKAQKSERLKRAMNPWDGLAEIRRFAREGFDSIPPEWIGTYFRWWGVYTQGDGAGVLGGKDGQGLAVPFFMLRIRIPNGLLRSDHYPSIGCTHCTRAVQPGRRFKGGPLVRILEDRVLTAHDTAAGHLIG